jgi:hypothetical protein
MSLRRLGSKMKARGKSKARNFYEEVRTAKTINAAFRMPSGNGGLKGGSI